MKFIKQLLEAKMKRSNPYVSGELDGPNPTFKTVPSFADMKIKPTNPVKKPSAFDTKILNLAKRANVEPREVEKLWLFHKSKIDISTPNAFGIITNKVKKDLGIT